MIYPTCVRIHFNFLVTPMFKNKFEVHIDRLQTELATQLLTLCSEIKVNVLRKPSFLKLVLRKCADDIHRLFCFAVTTTSIHK